MSSTSSAYPRGRKPRAHRAHKAHRARRTRAFVGSEYRSGKDSGALSPRGIFKEKLHRVIPVTTRVAIWRRVNRHRLALREPQEARIRVVHGEGDIERVL